jgi:hypothetical protein
MWLYCNNKGTYCNIKCQGLWIKYNCTKYNTSTNQCDYTCNNKRSYSNGSCQVLWLQYNSIKYNTKRIQCDFTVIIIQDIITSSLITIQLYKT